MEAKKPLIVLTGATATGKTRLSIALAKAIGGEIISADSMQVYQYMDIGSAKISHEEMQGVKHHMIDCLKPWEEFNVAIFAQKARENMEEIYHRKKIPILVGGTGFYIQAVLYQVDFTEYPENPEIRRKWETVAAEKGNAHLHACLRQVDAKSAELIHENNVKRVIRALEFKEQTGRLISEHNETERQKASPFDFRYFVLDDKREKIYESIDKRVDSMMEKGLVEEVRMLLAMGCKRDFVAMQGLGYKEIMDYLEGTFTLEEAVRILKRDTRHFAKRQLTWFKREKDVIWISKEDFGYDEDSMLSFILDKIQKE